MTKKCWGIAIWNKKKGTWELLSYRIPETPELYGTKYFARRDLGTLESCLKGRVVRLEVRAI